MRLKRLVARGYRNLADLEWEPPPAGVALVGANAQGKTNLLEAIYYPVLFRSFRGAPDQQIAAGPPGFHVEVELEGSSAERVAATYSGRKKRIGVDGVEVHRVTDAVGTWLAVAFQPADLALATGPAAERRRYVDRLLSLASKTYLRALTSYRAALAQRNSALRQGRLDMALAFNRSVAQPGAVVVQQRLAWVAHAAEQFAAELACLDEPLPAHLQYHPGGGAMELSDPDTWEMALHRTVSEDRARGMTTVGPHRDDLVLELGGRRLREYGSTGQQRSAAVGLKLIEVSTLRQACGTEPVLLLDDVFAELDRERQNRLAMRLWGQEDRQVFVTSPRRDELPAELELPVWVVEDGRVR